MNQVSYLEKNLDELLDELGRQVSDKSKDIFPVDPIEAIEYGKFWMNYWANDLQQIVCKNPTIQKYLANDSDEKTIFLEVLNAIISAKFGIAPAVIAAILVKKGLNIYCSDFWKNDFKNG